MRAQRMRLGAIVPPANSALALYVVPSNDTVVDVVMSGIWVTNIGVDNAKYRLAVSDPGEAELGLSDFLRYDKTITGNDTHERVLRGVILMPQQTLWCYSDIGNVNFIAYAQVNLTARTPTQLPQFDTSQPGVTP